MEDTAPRFTAQIIPLDEKWRLVYQIRRDRRIGRRPGSKPKFSDEEMELIAKVFERDHPDKFADTDALIARAFKLVDDPSYR